MAEIFDRNSTSEVGKAFGVDISSEVKKKWGIKDYFNVESVLKDIEIAKDIFKCDIPYTKVGRRLIADKGGSSYRHMVGNWGNSFNTTGRSYAVMILAAMNPQAVYDFCRRWVSVMSTTTYFDDRNADSVKACKGLDHRLNFTEEYLEPIPENVQVAVGCALDSGEIHRTVQQFLNRAFLVGLYASACALGKNEIKQVFLDYYDASDELTIFSEIRFACI